MVLVVRALDRSSQLCVVWSVSGSVWVAVLNTTTATSVIVRLQTPAHIVSVASMASACPSGHREYQRVASRQRRVDGKMTWDVEHDSSMKQPCREQRSAARRSNVGRQVGRG